MEFWTKKTKYDTCCQCSFPVRVITRRTINSKIVQWNDVACCTGPENQKVCVSFTNHEKGKTIIILIYLFHGSDGIFVSCKLNIRLTRCTALLIVKNANVNRAQWIKELRRKVYIPRSRSLKISKLAWTIWKMVAVKGNPRMWILRSNPRVRP